MTDIEITGTSPLRFPKSIIVFRRNRDSNLAAAFADFVDEFVHRHQRRDVFGVNQTEECGLDHGAAAENEGTCAMSARMS